MNLILPLVAMAVAGFAAAHHFEVRGSKGPATAFLMLGRGALLLIFVLVLVSTCTAAFAPAPG